MSSFAITHVDELRVRRRLLVGAATRDIAIDAAERLYGLALYLCAVRVKDGAQ